MEPSSFQLNVLRKCADHALDISPSTEVRISSSKQLNLNISEPLIEVRDPSILYFLTCYCQYLQVINILSFLLPGQ